MTNNSENKIVDHLFRHQYGKMVAIMTKVFGPSKLELIEDAIQDTFIKASLKWRSEIPDNPEAWLTTATKNRIIDLIRQINSQNERHESVLHPSVALELNEFFLDHEVEDSQLRMIFLACHPIFSKDEQIAFALKCISGFSMREIASALLQKEETIKKRLARAKKKIQQENISLDYPDAPQIQSRLSVVLQTIYLIFNEGFHSTKADQLLDKELCGEALRLCRHLLAKEHFRSGSLYALFALLCYHSSRLESKIINNKIIDLEAQDRNLWHQPLIHLGHQALIKSEEYEDHSIYHLEAAIAKEHVTSPDFQSTNWENILSFYHLMNEMMASDQILLSQVTVHIQMNDLESAKRIMNNINLDALKSRKYLYHGTMSKLYEKESDIPNAIIEIDKAIESCSNEMEKQYLMEKKALLSDF